MSRRRSARQKRRLDGVAGGALVALGLVLILSLAGLAWWLKKTRTQIDVVTNCPIDGPRAVHLIIIDRSDPISGQQAQRIKQVIDRYKVASTFGERFDVFTFEGDSNSALSPILVVCSPGRPDDANELIENPELIRQRYEERFSSVLDRVIDNLVQESERPTSPIMESIRAAALTSLGPLESGSVPIRVTLVSDMIQHSERTSHYREPPDFGSLSGSSAWPLVRPDFKGASVEILYLLRPTATRGGEPIQNRGHQRFWEEYVLAGFGSPKSIEPF